MQTFISTTGPLNPRVGVGGLPFPFRIPYPLSSSAAAIFPD